MTSFTPLSSFMGGILIGLSATLLLWLSGRIAGISGMMAGLLNGQPRHEWAWRLTFLFGIVVGAYMAHQFQPALFQPRAGFPFWMLALGGFLVGFGTRMGSGCTSGHAICGIARLSSRSIIATITFMAAGLITTFVLRHIIEPTL